VNLQAGRPSEYPEGKLYVTPCRQLSATKEEYVTDQRIALMQLTSDKLKAQLTRNQQVRTCVCA
jgi:hypothetical protein